MSILDFIFSFYSFFFLIVVIFLVIPLLGFIIPFLLNKTLFLNTIRCISKKNKFYFFLFTIGIVFFLAYGLMMLIRKDNENVEADNNADYISIISGNSISKNAISISLLIKQLKSNNIRYKIIDNINLDEFINELKNPKNKGMFLFGHGSIHGLDLNGENYYYCNLRDIEVPHKFFIQLHCNHGIGDSLPECLGISDSRNYFEKGKRNEIINLAWLLSKKNFLLNFNKENN